MGGGGGGGDLRLVRLFRDDLLRALPPLLRTLGRGGSIRLELGIKARVGVRTRFKVVGFWGRGEGSGKLRDRGRCG